MRGKAQVPADWDVVRLGDVADVAFSSVDKRTVDGEIPVELCNYTSGMSSTTAASDAEMDFMTATASTSECQRWALRKGATYSLPRTQRRLKRSVQFHTYRNGNDMFPNVCVQNIHQQEGMALSPGGSSLMAFSRKSDTAFPGIGLKAICTDCERSTIDHRIDVGRYSICPSRSSFLPCPSSVPSPPCWTPSTRPSSAPRPSSSPPSACETPCSTSCSPAASPVGTQSGRKPRASGPCPPAGRWCGWGK